MKFITIAFWSAVFGRNFGLHCFSINCGIFIRQGAAVLAIIVGEIAIIAIPAISGSAASKAVIHKIKIAQTLARFFYFGLPSDPVML